MPKQELGIDLEYRNIGTTKEEGEVAVAIAAGVGPDIYFSATENMTMDMTPFVQRWKDRDRIPPAAGQAGTWQPTRSICRIPQYVDNRGLALNQRLFAEAGINPVIPKDWNQIVQYVQKLKRADPDSGTITQGGLHWYFDWYGPIGADFGWLVRAAGGSINSPDMRKTMLNSQATRDTTDFTLALWDAATHFNREPPATLWLEGKTAVARLNAHMVGEFQQKNPSDTLVIGPLQVSPALSPASPIFLNGFSIMKTARDPLAAWESIELMLQPEMQLEFAVHNNTLVVRQEVAKHTSIPQIAAKLPFYQMLSYGIADFYVDPRPEVCAVLQKTMLREKAAETALEEIVQLHQMALDYFWAQ